MQILIADDHDLVRETISAFLEKEGQARVQSAGDLPQAIKIAKRDGPFDLILLDYNMPGMNGLAGLAEMRKAFPDTSVALLSGNISSAIVQEAIDMGAVGFVPKTIAAKSLVNAVRFMVAGEVFLPVSLLQEDAPTEIHPMAEMLSRRETEVLSGLCRGQSNKEIARDLDLQEVTIKLHVRTLCRKLGARNRTQAAMMAKEAGLY